MIKKILTLVIALIFCGLQAQEQVTNTSYRPGDKSALKVNGDSFTLRMNEFSFKVFKEKLLFFAKSSNSGYRMRYTDGESDSKVIDNQDECTLDYSIGSYSTVINDVLYIVSESNCPGERLYIKKIVDPSQGLIPVAMLEEERSIVSFNFNEGGSNRPFQTVVPLSDSEFAFFSMNALTSDVSLWKSDGTQTGTIKFQDQIDYNILEPITNINEKILYGNGSNIWVSDGTIEGSKKLLDQDLELIEFSEQVQGYTYFLAGSDNISNSNTDKIFLIKTDGTPENTIIIKEFEGSREDLSGDLLVANDKIFVFIENSPPAEFSSSTHFGNRVWEIDDVLNTTKLIYEEEDNLEGGTYSNLISTAEDLVFTGLNENGITLLKYNYESSNLSLIKELTDLDLDILIAPIYLHKLNATTIAVSYYNNYIRRSFLNFKPYTGKDVYISDLTTEGTNRNEKLIDIDNITNFKNKLFFSRLTEEYGNELWSSDGTNQGTEIYENLNKQTFETFEYDIKYNLLGDKLIYHDERSDKVISFNFTTHEFSDLLDINTLGEDDFGYVPFDQNLRSKNTILNDRSYLLFRSGSARFKDRTLLISSDGNVENTKVEDNARFFENKDGYIAYNHIHNDKMYFVELINNLNLPNSDNATLALSSFDGENYSHIKTLGELPFTITSSNVAPLAGYSASDKFYISLSGNLSLSGAPNTGIILVSDTTEGGTTAINNTISAKGIIFKDEFYFTGIKNPESRRAVTYKLMKINKLTNLVEVINESIDSVDSFTVLNDELFFTAASADFGVELWKTDGTSEGTKMIKDINEGVRRGVLSDLEVLGDEMFFRARGTNRDLELWKSDGTEEGTIPVIEEVIPVNLKAISDKMYFGNVITGALLKTDGTIEGTQEVFNVSFGDRPVPPDSLIRVGEYIYFIAGSVESCSQVWRFKDNDFELSVPEKVIDSEITFYPNPTQDSINFENGTISAIELYDMKGAKVLSVDKIEDNKLNISSLPKGVYLLTCKINGVNTVKKIVKN